ncbi:hypothetical protein [Tenacibaculum jejuense]|uniref:Probable lipoprotein n=1 Tax=Tenacibaculum jejuense TaxID=584609 RepID=A0A238UBG2_9FLAO|nr:hypothetical protein [Tenacibaculum jejuense]SNR16316.1 Probable lipoprotein precursor [Tenacibaculum jejuense]
MRNLKFLLCIVVFVFTVSCTDNTENLVTNTRTTNASNVEDTDDFGDSINIPIDGTGNGNDYTGGSSGNGGDTGGKGN